MRGVLLALALLFLCCDVTAALSADVPHDYPVDEDGLLNVFVVAHSHDDAGWLRTVDSYYEWEVSYILDTVITCLLENPQRKFIEVEMAFFTRWWAEQTDTRKEQVRGLVRRGQLEFVNGGWVMNDEAVTNYVSVINQMTQGHLFILENFGVTPQVAWHIDPFGASAVTPTLWAEAGFKYFVIARIDYRLKDYWKKNQGLEFVWEGSSSLGAKTEIFTHVLEENYCTPQGFDWEHGVSQNLPEGDGPPVVITQAPSYVTPANVHRIAEKFARMAKGRAQYFKTPNVIIPFGCDFNFQNALMKYKNMDKLIDYINQHSTELGIRAQYSTLSDYFEAVHNTQTTWSRHSFDFFPYIDNSMSYWSGYFTSRPDLKQLCRETDATMRSSEIILALGGGNLLSATAMGENVEQMNFMRRAAALSQHHDAVTGTERRVTYRDYRDRLLYGAEIATNVSTSVLQDMTQTPMSLSSSNATLWAALMQGQPAGVMVYNSLEFTRTQYATVNIPIANVQVYDDTGKTIPAEVHSALEYGSTGYTLFFRATIPPMGYASYTIKPSTTLKARVVQAEIAQAASTLTLDNEYLQAQLDGNGNLRAILNKGQQKTMSCVQSMMYYLSTNSSAQPSGAYIFRPAANVAPINMSNPVPAVVSKGSLVQQVLVTFNESNVQQVIRLYTGLDSVMGGYVDLQMHLGPLQVPLHLAGKEYIARFATNLNNQKIFYTDDSGLELQTRYTNYPNGRPGDYDEGVVLAGNYYPVVSRMYLKNTDMWQFTILTAHSHGGSSLRNGEAEIMLHRRLTKDDYRGVGQALDDPHEVSPRFFLISDNPSNSSVLHRRLANVVQYPLENFYLTSSTGNITLPSKWAPLVHDLPYNIRIITLKQRDSKSNVVILRLMNIFESNENPMYAKPTSVDLTTLFSGYKVTNVEERTLTTNMPITENVRPQWNTTSSSHSDNYSRLHENTISPRDLVVTLSPMEIKSFWLELVPQ